MARECSHVTSADRLLQSVVERKRKMAGSLDEDGEMMDVAEAETQRADGANDGA
jgi:hypothetical protein